MTVVQPNSIAGINSISVQSGQSLSIHKSDGTLIREIVASTGISTYSSISVGSATTTNNANKSINIGLGASIAQHADNSLSFGTNGDERLRIDSGGRIGIGIVPAAGEGAELSIKSSDGQTNVGLIPNTNSESSQLTFYNAANDSAQGYIKYNNSDNSLQVRVNLAERLRITSAGDVGISTLTPASKLHLYDAASDGLIVQSPSGLHYVWAIQSSGNLNNGSLAGELGIRAQSGLSISANGGTSTQLRLDSSGRLLVGTASDVAPDSFGSLLQIDSGSSAGSIALGRHTASGSGPVLLFHKSRSGSGSGATIVQDGDNLGTIRFFGADGTDRNSYGAQISANVDGTPGSNDMPGNLLFSTTADGAASPTERLRIDSSGRILAGVTASRSVGTVTAHLVQVEAVDATAGVSITRCSANTVGPYLSFGKSRAGSLGDDTVVQSGDALGMIRFAGADGADTENVGALIQAIVDGTPGTDDMPGRLQFSTTADGANTATERLRIDSSGNVTVKTTDVTFGGAGILRINSGSTAGALNLDGGSSNHGGEINLTGGSNGGRIQFRTGQGSGQQSEKMRLDENGKLLIGHTSSTTVTGEGLPLQVQGSDGYTGASLIRTSAAGAQLQFAAGSSGNNVADNTGLGYIKFFGYHTNGYDESARIHAEIDGTPGDGDAPGAIVFSTTNDGASSVTERMRITSSGVVDVAGHFASSTSGQIDPDDWTGHFITGNIQDGSGWGVHGIAFGDATGDMMGIGHNGTSGFFGMQNGSASTMETFIKFVSNGEVELSYNAGFAARTIETNSLRGFLVGSDTYVNESVTHGELIVRKDLASPNDAAITDCARMTIITNEQTAGGNGYGGAIFFGTQDVSTSNQYTTDMAGCGGSADGSDTANAEKSGSFYIWTRNGATLSAKFKVRYDGNLYGTDTSIGSLSDNRLKENIEDFSFDLNKFKQLQPKRFNWKHPEYHGTTPSSGKHRGFIAQDLEAIDAELVDTDKIDKDNPERSLVDADGLGKTTYLGKSDAMYVSVINQLIAKIETLETKVAALESS